VVEPRRKVRLRREGAWVQVGTSEVTHEAWWYFWNAFCRSANLDPRSQGYVSVLLGDIVLAEAVLPPLASTPIFMAEKRPAPLGLDGLIGIGMLDAATADEFRAVLAARRSILILGSSEIGRSALLEALVDTLPRGERIAVVERRSTLRLTSPAAVRLRSANGQGEAAVAAGLAVSPDWIVVNDAEPQAAAAVAWRLRGAAAAALVGAGCFEADAWRQRAADALVTQLGSWERAYAEIRASFALTVQLAPGPAGPQVAAVERD
jgi:hypothetical protein